MSLDLNFEGPPSAGSDFVWIQDTTRAPGAAPPPLPPAIPIHDPALPRAWSPPPPRQSGLSSVFRGANQWIGNVIQRLTLPEDTGPVDPFGKLVATTPPWLISLIVHFSIMIFLGLAVFGARTVIVRNETPVEMQLGERPDDA